MGEHNYSAYVPDLPACIATGRTVEEVTQLIRKRSPCTWKGYERTAIRSLSQRPYARMWTPREEAMKTARSRDAQASLRPVESRTGCIRLRHSLQRSTQARRDFMSQSGYLRGRPDYEIDHVVPLACGGPDHPENMQGLSRTEKRAKDAVKRRGFRRNK